MNPTLPQAHNTFFNVVDCLKTHLGLLKYPYRIDNPLWVWLVCLVILAMVNSWSLYCDLLQQKYVEDDELSLKSFVYQIIYDLL